MLVTVKLFATLRINREKESSLVLDTGSSIRQALKLLEIPVNDVAITFVNGRSVKPDHTLSDNDVLSVFPPVGGG